MDGYIRAISLGPNRVLYGQATAIAIPRPKLGGKPAESNQPTSEAWRPSRIININEITGFVESVIYLESASVKAWLGSVRTLSNHFQSLFAATYGSDSSASER
jgi:hypothetical protein